MCCFKPWFEINEETYVLQCVDCHTYQVRLRNTSLLFDPFAYIAFRDFVSTAWELIEADQAGDPVAIPTSNPGMDLLLDKEQLGELYRLLDSADTEIKMAQITSLLNRLNE